MIFQDNEMGDIIRLLPKLSDNVGTSQIKEALEKWSTIIDETRPIDGFNIDVRSDLQNIQKAARHLAELLTVIDGRSESRLAILLGREDSALSGSRRTQVMKERLDCFVSRLDSDTNVKFKKIGDVQFRATLAQLMMIWRWATGKNTFGEAFDHFAAAALTVVLGWEHEVREFSETRRDIQKDMKKRPDRYKLYYLSS